MKVRQHWILRQGHAAVRRAAAALILFFGVAAFAADYPVTSVSDIVLAMAGKAQPGDTLTMRDGFWPDADIIFSGNGTAGNPITLRAQTPGQVILSGASRLRMSGSFLVVDGLKFANGYYANGEVISFRSSSSALANNCRVSNCAIIDYNPDIPEDSTNTWISIYGVSNRVDHCYVRGKDNVGTTLVVWVASPENPNYDQIDHNYFGFRPALGINGGETIRVGDSGTSIYNSRTVVENNYFEQCSGDVEIISSKSCENIYRHNTFVDCEGHLSLRHGNRSQVYGNYFFGHGKPLTGGVRIIAEDHQVYNNYFDGLAGTATRVPLSIMQGLENSPLNGYFQVKRALVAFNTFVNCSNTMIIGLSGTLTGSSQVTTLPPLDCIIANNLVLATSGKMVDQRTNPVNMTWQGNIMYGAPLSIPLPPGIVTNLDPGLALAGDGLWRPVSTSPALAAAQGSYDSITDDMEGQARPGAKDVGCDQLSGAAITQPPLSPIDAEPGWMQPGSVVVTWANPTNIIYGRPLGVIQLNATANVPGDFAYTPTNGAVLGAGNGQVLSVIFTPHDLVKYSVVTQSVTINVTPATPLVVWPTPAAIAYGTPLTGTQLNAAAGLPGSFDYAPGTGTVLDAGIGQALTVVFTPVDNVNYLKATNHIGIDVSPATPIITWNDPAAIDNGTPLGPAQLNATANAPGTFAYQPGTGAVLDAGSDQLLTVIFTPTAQGNYLTATQTVRIDVTIGGKLVPSLAWATPGDIPFGTALSGAQLNATADVPGNFIYNPAVGTVLNPGNQQMLSVTFLPSDGTTYAAVSRRVRVNVMAPLNNAMVRLAYLIPSNRVAQASGVAALQNAVLFYQSWFRDQMRQNGFGPKTFTVETMPDGVTPKVYTVGLNQSDSFLRGDFSGGRLLDAARAAGITIGATGEVWWVVGEMHAENPDGSILGGFDLGYNFGGPASAPGWALSGSDALVVLQDSFLTNNTIYDGAIVPDLGPYPLTQDVSFPWFDGISFSSVSSAALGAGLRELGEAFGLDHDFRNDENFNGNVMGYGFSGIRGAAYPKLYPYNSTRLSYGSALALNVSPYFNFGQPISDSTKPTVTVTTSGTSFPLNGLLRISFSASDASGLSAALLSWNKDSDKVLVDEMKLGGTSVNRSFATTYFEAGRTNVYTLSVFDQQGNKQTTTFSLFPINSFNQAPQPFVTVTPAVVGLGEDVVLDASGTFDPEHSSALLEVEWDLDGDGIFDTFPSNSLLYTNHYTTVGSYLIRARVSDPAGAQAVSAPVAVDVTLCQATLHYITKTHGSGATTGTNDIKTTPQCNWTSASLADWITITGTTNYVGPANVVYALTENLSLTSRTGMVVIADQLFTIIQSGIVCSYSFSPTNRFLGFGATANTVKLSTKAPCSWSVSNNNDWIAITANASGQGGPINIGYSLSANPNSTPRVGMVNVGDQFFWITQWGRTCSYVLSPVSWIHGAGVETGMVSVAANSTCPWTAVNTNDWIILTGNTAGTGSGTVGYYVTNNPGNISRSGAVTINGQPYTVTQSACTFSVFPASLTNDHLPDTGAISVTTTGACSWVVLNPSPWITIQSPADGTGIGAGVVSYSVDNNPLYRSRTGVLTVAGQPVTIVQSGLPCTNDLSLTEWDHGAGAEAFVVSVTASSDDCQWNVVNPVDWIDVLTGPTGHGNDDVIYTVAANDGPARSTTLVIAGLPFRVTQARGLRVATLGDLAIASGQTACLPIVLDAHGDENRLDLSLCFDPSLLAFSSARLGSGGVGGTLTTNTTRAGLGQVGISWALPPGWSMSGGLQTVVEVCFRGAAITGNVMTAVSVCDQPFPATLVDVLGQTPPLVYSNASVRVVGFCTLAESLDAPALNWTTDVSAPWLCQTNQTHDGVDAAQSGAIGNNASNSMQATIAGPATVTFWWKVSSEPTNDSLRFLVGGVEQARISGEVGWQSRTSNIPAGNQVVQWTYAKNGSVAAGLDRGWVDQVQVQALAPTITSQPTSQSVDAGTVVIFSVTASATPPITYQWQYNGTNLTDGPLVSGSTTASLRLTNVQPAQSGFYSVAVSNVSGGLASASAILAVTPLLPLAEALEAPDWIWVTNGTVGWVGQSVVTHDGVDAARSGAILKSSTTSMQITQSGPGTITFWWKVSSETNNDTLIFYTGNSGSTEQARISGEVDWQQRSFNLSAGAQILKWTYSKNSSTDAGQDRAWVDQVQFTPAPPAITTQPVGQNVDAGATVTFTVAATGTPPLSYRWQFNGSDLSDGGSIRGATTATLTLSNAQPAQSGAYSVVVGNSVANAISTNAALGVTPILSLTEALDGLNLIWATNTSPSGGPPWVGQTAVTHDGVDAARSGVTPDSGRTSFTTTINGPGVLSFWWKVSSEAGADELRFYLAGSKQEVISGEVDWTWRVYNIPSGSGQALEWRYTKSSSGAAGQDRGWVDQILYISNSVPTAPVIGLQPVGQSAVAPATVRFSALAVGSTPLSYQWQFNPDASPGSLIILTNGGVVSGATTTNLTLTAIGAAQAGTYSVVVSNAFGRVTSSNAILAVVTAPVITNQPAGQSVVVGTTVTLSVGAVGLAPLKYQWRLNGTNLANTGNVSGATNASLKLTSVLANQAGTYSVVVTNSAGTATSVDAVLAVMSPPAITLQPLSQSARAGTNVLFNAGASGTSPLSYQWRFNGTNLADGVNINGSLTPSLVVSNIQSAQVGTYSLFVSNSVGSITSSNALLAVIIPPAITNQPAGQNLAEGLAAAFSAGAAGTAPLSYQWRLNGTNVVNGGVFNGATNPSLTISAVHPAQAGNYSVLVSNLAGVAVSANAPLTVVAAMTLADAVNAPFLAWNTSLSAPWVAQTNLTHDRVGAARSGAITNNQTTWFETTVQGPGTVRFWWKVSSETNHDALQFLVNGVVLAAVSGEVDWQRRTFDLPAGIEVLRWNYAKDGSATNGQDRAWLDEVEFTPTVGPVVPVIMSQPLSQTASPGATVAFGGEVTGTAPLSYQWRFNGADMSDSETVSGATTDTLLLANVQPGQAGAYTLFVRNNYSTATSSNALLSVTSPITLAQALDTTNIIWVLGGFSAWLGQNSVSFDGAEAAQSGVIPNNQSNWVEATVAGPEAVTFWWKVSSETNHDRLRFSINGVEQANISGEVGWQWRTFDLTNLTQVVRWAYTKDTTGTAGLDRGWLDQVQFGPLAPTINREPLSQIADLGAMVDLNVSTSGTKPINYQWHFNGANLADDANTTGTFLSKLILSNSTPARSGVYDVTVINAGGRVVSTNAFLTVSSTQSMAQAVDATTNFINSGFVTTGDAFWFAETTTTQDGVDAMQSGQVVNGQRSSLQTTIVGPGKISFWWKVSSQTNPPTVGVSGDSLKFYIAGSPQNGISGEVNWQLQIYDLTNVGPQTVEWRYQKNSALTSGANAGWVDQIQYAQILPPILTNHPASQNVDPGTTVSFNVGAVGSPPFGYQWMRNGVNLANGNGISGATTATLSLSSVQPVQAGTYSVAVSNAAARVVSSNAVLSVTPSLPLADALDIPGWIWTTVGSPPWFGQSSVSSDGVDAARNARIGDSASTSLQTTQSGPGTISFYWKVSSEATKDFLQFAIGSTLQAQISGEVDWTPVSFAVPAGSQVLKWTYTKNSSLSAGQDLGWVDRVQFVGVGAGITGQPSAQTVDATATVSFNVAAAGTPPFTYQWQLNGVDLANGPGVGGATSATLTLTNVQPGQTGFYSVNVSNAWGGATSFSAPLTVSAVVSLTEALDTPASWIWVTNGTPPWIGQLAVNHDGVDAARSGAIGNNTTTSMQITQSGPGTITFWWAVSSEPTNDALIFYAGSSGTTEQARISGEVQWQQRSFNIGSGTQILKWTYSKNNNNIVGGADRGWVDQVQFGPTPPSITNQPASRSVDMGATVAFSVGATGGALTYQWQLNGANVVNGGTISGATTPTLTLSNVQPAQVGNYSVIVSNSATSIASSNAVLAVTPLVSLTEALDTVGWTWTTNGTPPWVGQTVVSHDGLDAARSGAVGNSSSNTMQTTVVGPATLSFWWKVSSETNNDVLRFKVGGVEQAKISGEVDWEFRSFNLAAGNQVLQWTYSKNGSVTGGLDQAWVDQVQLGSTPPVIATQPVGQSVDMGMTVSLGVAVGGTPPLTYQWLLNGINLSDGGNVSGAGTASLTITNAQPGQSGNYSVVVTNSSGSITSVTAVVTVASLTSLAEALDTLGWTWTTTGTPAWVGQSAVTHDGVDAARSGALGNNASNSMQTSVAGPATVSFWWKVSSETNNDVLRFTIGGVEQAKISGEVGWEFRSFNVPAGNQVLQWTYSKNGSVSNGLDRAWVDQVFVGTIAPMISTHPASQNVELGMPVNLSVVVAGTPPLTYQWQFNGNGLVDGGNVSGAATANLALSNLQQTQVGGYTVVVANSAGSITSSVAVLTVPPLLGLPEALDTSGWTWTTTGSSGWVGQSVVAHDNVDAARNGATDDGGSNSMQTILTGPGTVSFWWKISSETNDILRFSIGGVEQARISGEVDWQSRIFPVPSGSQVVEWSYVKNGSLAAGADRGWVDQVQFVPGVPGFPLVSVQPLAQSAGENGFTTLSVAATGTAPLSYQWLFNGANLAASTSAVGVATSTLTLTNISPAQAGAYSVRVSNAIGVVTSSVAPVTVIKFSDAVDAPLIAFAQGGSAPWVAQTAVTQDHVDAAQSGVIPGGVFTKFETHVTGPATVSFWWKVSSLTNSGVLSLTIGSTVVGQISGEVDWQLVSFPVPTGTQLLKWRYQKSGSTAAGQDAAWIDQIAFPGSAPAPPVLATPLVVNLSRSANSVVLNWAVNAGKTYEVLYKDDLLATDWAVLGAPIVVTDSVATVTDIIGDGQPQRFYMITER